MWTHQPSSPRSSAYGSAGSHRRIPSRTSSVERPTPSLQQAAWHRGMRASQSMSTPPVHSRLGTSNSCRMVAIPRSLKRRRTRSAASARTASRRSGSRPASTSSATSASTVAASVSSSPVFALARLWA